MGPLFKSGSGSHILICMIAIALLLAAAIPIHLVWLRKKRLSVLPELGSKWLYGAYLSVYRAEVIDQHPFTGEITIARVKVDDPLELRTTLRVDAKKFLSTSKPYREKRRSLT